MAIVAVRMKANRMDPFELYHALDNVGLTLFRQYVFDVAFSFVSLTEVMQVLSTCVLRNNLSLLNLYGNVHKVSWNHLRIICVSF